jgi:hypothetical protein
MLGSSGRRGCGRRTRKPKTTRRHEYAHARHFSELLRACRERPRGRRAAEQRDERATLQFIKLHPIPHSVTPRGLLVTNTGLTTQIVNGLTFSLYKDTNTFNLSSLTALRSQQ